jgi:lipopolysaccharide transport system ATP-binding protein
MSGAAVVFNGVSKKFRKGERHDSLRDLIPAALGRLLSRSRSAGGLEDKEFWAVQDVSFEVRAGEALGIIGANGAGKSTILKLLTRILRPTSGHCQVVGRAGALIEVAAGFHPDLTGRENVFLQGAIMGMKREEISRKFDEIVEFAGLGEFISTQVKRYSSGMNARLGFSIAAHLDPDVLLIDEVLSVGDATFQEKCITRMRELIGRGMPIVFISHNLPAILELCTRVIVMDHGAVKFDGDPAAAIQHYRHVPWTTGATADPVAQASPIRIVGAELLHEHGDPSAVFHTAGAMRIRIRYAATRPLANAAFAIDIHRGDGVYCAGIDTMMDGQDLGVLHGQGEVDLMLPQLNLLPGSYLISVGVRDDLAGMTLDLHRHACPFSVMSSDRREFGVVYLPHVWSHRAESATVEDEQALSAVNTKDYLLR